tara:strand:+ start:2330 stop:2638 length:309 start_codon:yes stop_codon:yes gene_type:complete
MIRSLDGRHLFGVVVRTFGLFFLVSAILTMGEQMARNPDNLFRSDRVVIEFVSHLALGLLLFMVADPIVNLAYRKTLEERVEIEKDRLIAEAQRMRDRERDQ